MLLYFTKFAATPIVEWVKDDLYTCALALMAACIALALVLALALATSQIETLGIAKLPGKIKRLIPPLPDCPRFLRCVVFGAIGLPAGFGAVYQTTSILGLFTDSYFYTRLRYLIGLGPFVGFCTGALIFFLSGDSQKEKTKSPSPFSRWTFAATLCAALIINGIELYYTAPIFLIPAGTPIRPMGWAYWSFQLSCAALACIPLALGTSLARSRLPAAWLVVTLALDVPAMAFCALHLAERVSGVILSD